MLGFKEIFTALSYLDKKMGVKKSEGRWLGVERDKNNQPPLRNYDENDTPETFLQKSLDTVSSHG